MRRWRRILPVFYLYVLYVRTRLVIDLRRCLSVVINLISEFIIKPSLVFLGGTRDLGRDLGINLTRVVCETSHFSLLTWCPGPALAGLGDLRLESREPSNSSILDDTTYMRAISQFYITFHNHIHLPGLPPVFSTTL